MFYEATKLTVAGIELNFTRYENPNLITTHINLRTEQIDDDDLFLPPQGSREQI